MAGFRAETPWYEFAVEGLLLLRRQQRTNLNVRIDEELVPLALKVTARFLDLRARVFHYLGDLITLRRRELEHSAHPLYRAFAGYSEQAVTVGECAASETDCDSGDKRKNRQ